MHVLAFLLLILAACSQPAPRLDSGAHLQAGMVVPMASGKQEQAQAEPDSRPPWPFSTAAETYSVTVRDVPVRDLLFVLARDAKLEIDIAPQVGGTVTLNAYQRPLPELLERIARRCRCVMSSWPIVCWWRQMRPTCSTTRCGLRQPRAHGHHVGVEQHADR